MSHPTFHEVLALVVGLHAIAGLQRITVQMQTMQRLVLQNPTAFFPRQESYYIFLDVGAHNRHSNDCVYVIVKVERSTRAPLDVDPCTVIPKAEMGDSGPKGVTE